jgi:hypothetical protein
MWKEAETLSAGMLGDRGKQGRTQRVVWVITRGKPWPTLDLSFFKGNLRFF